MLRQMHVLFLNSDLSVRNEENTNCGKVQEKTHTHTNIEWMGQQSLLNRTLKIKHKTKKKISTVKCRSVKRTVKINK